MLDWEFKSPFTYLGGGSYTHDSKNLSLDCISFVSFNWVVINYQKGRDYKYNQALLWFFGIDDHQIRGLMRFIEMTSRESKNEDDEQVVGVLITKGGQT